MPKLIKRCATCKAIEIDGEVIPLRDYWPEFFRRLGYEFSDTHYLSRQCSLKLNGDPRLIQDNDMREILEWEFEKLRHSRCY